MLQARVKVQGQNYMEEAYPEPALAMPIAKQAHGKTKWNPQIQVLPDTGVLETWLQMQILWLRPISDPPM
ncbi:hypothetical protein KIL84_009753 [Mauremys mutica]|uniref:Uncharacterized protein n=1 Tax=Mauremys mutica TaxID=74926 RepID=A0A9D3XK09_9SAUR|nr:hypothetical protein KIL84_009753 [Mauremys mutica]